jgi:aerobic carbon-monoxide dehydrogenase medium subunit
VYPAPIESYDRPATIEEAVAAIGGGDGALFLAGGQSMMQAMKSRLLQPRRLVDLQGVGALKGVSAGADGSLVVGAMTRYVELAAESRLGSAYAALSDAATHVGDRQVRNRGTIGGSLCWNYIAACMPAVALGLGATLHLVSAQGSRTLPAGDFLRGPLETARQDGELLVSVALPPPPPRTGSAYRKWALLSDGLPVIGACVLVSTDAGGACSAARVAFGGLATGPRRSHAAEERLRGCHGGDRERIGAAIAAAAEELETQGDLWADAGYRKQLIRTLGAEMAASAFARASGKGPGGRAV